MLDIFRKRGAMSVVYSALLGAVILVFIIQFRPNSGSPMGAFSRKCVAKVRGTCIDEKDWRAQRYLLRGPYEGGGTTNWNKAALDSLIERTLLEQEADRVGLRVTEDDVMNELIREKVYVYVPVAMRPLAQQIGVNYLGFRRTQFGTKDKPFDQQVFEKVIRATTGQNVPEFTDSQAQELRAYRMLALVAERVRVSDGEAWEQFKHDRSTTTLRYVKFDPAFFAERFAPLDAASIDKWADEHKAEVDAAEAKWPKEQAKLILHPRHILIESKKDDPADKKAAASKKANELAEFVRKGDDFAKLAKDNSSDPGSKDKGGEYDWTSGQEYVAEFRDGLAKLKVGEVSVVETQFGFHVIQVLGRFDGRTAVAFSLYREAKGGELAKDASEKISAALKGKLPVVLDDALKAKVEEAKKAGKPEVDAIAQITEDEAKARTAKAIESVLDAMAPPAPVKKDEKKEGAKKDEKPAAPPVPAWQTDERRPRLEDGQPFVAGAPPIDGLAEPQPIIDAALKLTKEAPLAGPIKSGAVLYTLVYDSRHEATRAEFDKDRAAYMGGMLAKKREDAIVNYVTSLREALTKDTLTVDKRYETDEVKKPGEAPQAPIEAPEDPY